MKINRAISIIAGVIFVVCIVVTAINYSRTKNMFPQYKGPTSSTEKEGEKTIGKETKQKLVPSLTPIWTFDEIPDLIRAQISRNGKWAVVASENRIALLDLENKTKLYDISVGGDVRHVSISDQGYAVAVCDWPDPKPIKVLSVTKGLIAELSEVPIEGGRHGYRPIWRDAVISPSGNSFYVDGFVKFNVPNTIVWNNASPPLSSNPNEDVCNWLAVSGNGEYIVCNSSLYSSSPTLISSDGRLLWKSTYKNDVINDYHDIAISDDASVIVYDTMTEVTIYSKDSSSPLIRLPYYGPVDVSDDGKIIVVGHYDRTNHQGKLFVFENLSFNNPLVINFPRHNIAPGDIAISSDGGVIAVSTGLASDSVLAIYDRTGKLKYESVTPANELSMSSDGKTLGCLSSPDGNHFKFLLYNIQ